MPDGRETSPYADDLYCPECGYSLRGLTSDRCPECGFALERVHALGVQIPWVHRRSIGVVRAYWRTVIRASFHGKKVFGDIPTIVVHDDAQHFRWVTVAIFSATALLVFASFCATSPDIRADLALNGWFRAIGLLAGLAAVAAATGLPSYLFHPRRLSIDEQNRAVAMSYYACAPLALVSLVLPLYAAATLLAVSHRIEFDSPPWLFLAATVAAFIFWWFQLVRLARTVFIRRWAAIRVGLLVPVLWLIVGGLIAGGIPWLTLYVVALIRALQ